jgi:1-acyl-sn-glycerol-3-phosphate acyltransferase
MSTTTTGTTEGIASIAGDADLYQTESRKLPLASRLFPSASFYWRMIGIVRRAAKEAKRGDYDDARWHGSSLDMLRELERAGVQFEISGLEHLRGLDSSCVIVGNHMSMLETVVLPCVIRPFMPVTFVVKDSLLTYPVFGHVMRSREPVAVTRSNPREDFSTVMKEGKERLDKGISVIVFPQTTRTSTFAPGDFNSIGVKLARRAKVPVVPLALITDAWTNGTLHKDLGRIDASKKVHIAFGAPLTVEGNGNAANEAVIRFIQGRMDAWRGGGA